METLTAKRAFQSVKASAEAICNSDTQEFPSAASAGDTFRQGDIYIEFMESVPAGAVPSEKPSAQLAPGTSQGSRHVLDSLAGVTQFTLRSPTALDGPVLDITEERTVTHPEHGNVVLPPGVYGVTYQRAYADELRRVAD